MQPETASAINTGGPLHETGPAPAGRCAVGLPTLGLDHPCPREYGLAGVGLEFRPPSPPSPCWSRQGRAGPGSADGEVNCAADVVPRRSPPKGSLTTTWPPACARLSEAVALGGRHVLRGCGTEVNRRRAAGRLVHHAGRVTLPEATPADALRWVAALVLLLLAVALSLVAERVPRPGRWPSRLYPGSFTAASLGCLGLMLDTASHRQVSTLAVLAAAAVLSAHSARRRCAVLADRRDAMQRRVRTLAARRRRARDARVVSGHQPGRSGGGHRPSAAQARALRLERALTLVPSIVLKSGWGGRGAPVIAGCAVDPTRPAYAARNRRGSVTGPPDYSPAVSYTHL